MGKIVAMVHVRFSEPVVVLYREGSQYEKFTGTFDDVVTRLGKATGNGHDVTVVYKPRSGPAYQKLARIHGDSGMSLATAVGR